MFTCKFFHNPKNDSIHIRFINNRKKAEMETELFGTEDALEDALSSHPKSKNMPLVRILSAMVSILRKMQYEYHEDGDAKVYQMFISRNNSHNISY